MRDAIRGHQRHSEPVQCGPERTHVDDRTHSRLALYEEQPRRLVGRSGGLSASVQLEAGPECPAQRGEPRTHLMRDAIRGHQECPAQRGEPRTHCEERRGVIEERPKRRVSADRHAIAVQLQRLEERVCPRGMRTRRPL